MTEVLLI